MLSTCCSVSSSSSTCRSTLNGTSRRCAVTCVQSGGATISTQRHINLPVGEGRGEMLKIMVPILRRIRIEALKYHITAKCLQKSILIESYQLNIITGSPEKVCWHWSNFKIKVAWRHQMIIRWWPVFYLFWFVFVEMRDRFVSPPSGWLRCGDQWLRKSQISFWQHRGPCLQER